MSRIDWSNLTKEVEASKINHFKTHDVKVPLGKYSNSDLYSFGELVNISSNLVKDRDIINKMLQINSQLATRPIDPLLPDLIFQVVTDEVLNDTITFTYSDLYVYLHGILRLRMLKRDKLALDARIKAVQSTIDATKTKAELRKEAKEELTELLKQKENFK